jgi:hypothetical protein
VAVLRANDGAFLGHYSDEEIAAVLFGRSSAALLYRDLPYPEVTRAAERRVDRSEVGSPQ